MRIGSFSLAAIMTATLTVLTFASPTPSFAADDEVIAALKAQVSALTKRLEALETKQRVPTQNYQTPAPRTATQSASWADKMKLKGDFRYRHEAFDIEGREDRHRQRIRARTELTAKVNDEVTVGFGLATGGSDPISTNQTIGNAGSSKSVVLDLAYAKWSTPFDGLTVVGGKFKNPLYRAGGQGLIWDGDLRPEGVGFDYANDMFFAKGLGFFLDEDSNGEDALLLGGQVGVDGAVGEGKLVAGVGYYHVTDAENRDVFFIGAPRGNLTNLDGTYMSDFEMLEGFAQYSFAIENTKITLFADYVQNLGADDFDTGYSLGAKLKQDAWNFGWAYQDLEADAVLGTLTDSDFIGGGTDGNGHILQAGYSLSKQISLNGTLFLNDRNMDFGTEEEFKRLMLDISFKY